MKKSLFILSAALIAISINFGLTSCASDGDSGTSDDKKITFTPSEDSSFTIPSLKAK